MARLGDFVCCPVVGLVYAWMEVGLRGHVWVPVVVFIFVLRGTCWGCLSHGGEGAGLFDGFVSRWPCGHDTVAHHVLNRRLS